MIGIDRNTGTTLDDWPQFVQRATRALSTPLGTRQKRPLYGSNLPALLAKNMTDELLILAQSEAVATFYNAANGISEFSPSIVVASRSQSGLLLRFEGTWTNRKMTFEVLL